VVHDPTKHTHDRTVIHASTKETSMLCPSCKDIDLAMTDRQGIEIDYCPKCRGIWLDRGELDRLIERSEQASPPPLPPSRTAPAPINRNYPQHGEHYKHGHPQKRPKSLLGELFDF
jgi:Zn-finger nucleic acid-binding protein